ncbi:hypothetical protein ATZ33_04490 [Enterococcus silesiacus]|uniref:DUF1803 domain-containing protein n=1 Tax=Enterococcus silesiacus TaxID=332949 RepID=A0A0S3K8M8_9ENTE|nr:DUF1803 domain-containing protein [Enterococcus silesiacus]ALS00656.1 hypothetical protein ATZ33_04490 [Enterococcus silesiacus]OJG86035.1 hypothetical protein RV15_GL002439 [Enterococcus silesiacus]
MENTSYYFASNKNEKKLENVISDPLFKKVVNYLSDYKNQEVILRQIKATISTDHNLELYLDKLIKHGLVERKNRRYSLTFPVYSTEEKLQVPDSVTNLLQSLIQVNSSQLNYSIVGEWLWSLFFEEEQSSYFFGVQYSSKKLPLFRKKVAGNDALQFVSIYQDGVIPLDLANYFNLLSKRQALPEQFKSLQTVIGDVDINYFIGQVQKVLRSVKRNTSRVKKQNIFEKALLATNDLTRNTEGQLSLVTMCLDDSEPSRERKMALNQLKTELASLWGAIEDDNQRVFFKMQLYSVLFTSYFPNKKFIHYFKS